MCVQACAGRQLAIAATPLPGIIPAGGKPIIGCNVRIERLVLMSGSTRGAIEGQPQAEMSKLAGKWEGLRSVCGACVAPSLPVAAGGTTNVGCHGGGVLFHSGLEGSTLEVVDSTFFNNTAQCGGGLMVTGRGTAVLTNSSFYDNIAGLSGVGSGVGGGLAAYSADSDVRIQQQWYASGSKVTVYVSTARSMC